MAARPLSSGSDRPPPRSASGARKRVRRAAAGVRVMLSLKCQSKVLADLIDVSEGGMHLRADRVPAYGDPLTVVARLPETGEWVVVPAHVRWFLGQHFGIEFRALTVEQEELVRRYVSAVSTGPDSSPPSPRASRG